MREIVTDINQLRDPAVPIANPQRAGEVAEILLSELRERGDAAAGLAANQLGLKESACILQGPPGQPPICLINPVFTKGVGSITAEETCLSLPGVAVAVPRPERIKVRAFNRFLAPVQYKFAGYMARKACHEIDHLKGWLIIDYEEGQTVCPVCGLATGDYLTPRGYYYKDGVAQETDELIREKYLLYQRGYDEVKREAGDGVIVCKGGSFISPRCQYCYEKEVAKDVL